MRFGLVNQIKQKYLLITFYLVKKFKNDVSLREFNTNRKVIFLFIKLNYGH